MDDDEKTLAEVLTRLLRNKKILKQANERAAKKTLCLASELRDDGEEIDATIEPVVNCPAAASGISLSPLMWSTLGALDDATLVGTAQASGDSS